MGSKLCRSRGNNGHNNENNTSPTGHPLYTTHVTHICLRVHTTHSTHICLKGHNHAPHTHLLEDTQHTLHTLLLKDTQHTLHTHLPEETQSLWKASLRRSLGPGRPVRTCEPGSESRLVWKQAGEIWDMKGQGLWEFELQFSVCVCNPGGVASASSSVQWRRPGQLCLRSVRMKCGETPDVREGAGGGRNVSPWSTVLVYHRRLIM